MRVTIFGPNLRDQSKGSYVIHAADCADCRKLKNEEAWTINGTSEVELVGAIYDDILAEASDRDEYADTLEACWQDVHFAPCTRALD